MFFRIFFLLTIVSSIAKGQENYLKFKAFNLENGLSNSNIHGIVQDKKGFMWFGTDEGLNRFDGYSFAVFKNTKPIPNASHQNYITELVEDNNGIIWASTLGAGILSFDPVTEKFNYYLNQPRNPGSLSHNTTNILFKDKNGIIWIGTEGGLDRLDPQKKEITRIFPQPNARSINVGAICQDKQGYLWFGSKPFGLFKMDTNGSILEKHVSVDNSSSFTSDHVNTLYVDVSNVLWIGTENGLFKFDIYNNTFRIFTHNKSPYSLSSNSIYSMYEDGNKNLWIGTINGLNKMSNSSESFERYFNNPEDKESLSSNIVSCLFRDREGDLWVGCVEGGGISKLIQEKKFAFIHRDEGLIKNLSSNEITSIYEDRFKNIWIGTASKGLYKLDSVNNTFYTSFPDNSATDKFRFDNIEGIEEDAYGDIWFASAYEGILRYNYLTKKTTQYLYNPKEKGSINTNAIWTIYNDRKNRLWFGTNGGGLNRFDFQTGKFSHYIHSPNDSTSISDDRVGPIVEDRQGLFWIGTAGGGVNRFDPSTGKFKKYFHDPHKINTLSDNLITSLLVDKKGDLWVGTVNGIDRYDKEKDSFIRYKQYPGIISNTICGILEDNNGNLWISTRRGISKFNPERKTYRNYDQREGLPIIEFGYSEYCKALNGKMYFGSNRGIIAFYPDSLDDNKSIPSLVLTGFRIFNKSVSLGKNSPLKKSVTATSEIELSYKQSSIGFEFSLLDYSYPEKDKYQYILKGLDRSWNLVGNRNYASYANIPPGNYVFQVKGFNSDNRWNDKDIAVKVIVKPPFWMTIWFEVLVVLIFLAMLFFVYKLKTIGIKRRNKLLDSLNKELEERVTERTQQLSEANETLSEQSEQIKQMNELLKKDNRKLESNVKDLAKARVMRKNVTFEEFCKIYPNEHTCFEFLNDLKWKEGYRCKKCENTNYTNGKLPFSRRCTKCGYDESVTSYTLFYHLKFPIVKAFYMLFLVTAKNDITIEKLSTLLQLSMSTCHAFKVKIIETMQNKKRGKNVVDDWSHYIL